MLEKKVFLLTGGSRGIGKEIYKYCLNVGNKVVTCSRNLTELQKTIEEIDPKGINSMGIKADVSQESDLKILVDETLKRFGQIDVLVNNAGVYGPIGLLENCDSNEWFETIRINLGGMVNLTKLVLPIMKKNKQGKIINLAGAGVGSSKPMGRFTAYYTSKMAVAGFTESLSNELLGENIQVNCISPGWVNTKLTEKIFEVGAKNSGEEIYSKAMMQKEKGGDSPVLAAKMVLFLSSDEACHINGKIISAKWDKIDDLLNQKKMKTNLFNIRRIDDEFFYEKSK